MFINQATHLFYDGARVLEQSEGVVLMDLGMAFHWFVGIHPASIRQVQHHTYSLVKSCTRRFSVKLLDY